MTIPNHIDDHLKKVALNLAMLDATNLNDYSQNLQVSSFAKELHEDFKKVFILKRLEKRRDHVAA